MRWFTICRNCAEVHPAEMECPACRPAAHIARPAPAAAAIVAPRVRDRVAPLEPTPARRLLRASTLVVSAYLLAVLVLILAVVAQA
jgi:hypothetical protein